MYVVDTGVDPAGRIPVDDGYSALPSDTSTVDCNGHGTHTAGLVASSEFGLAQRAVVVPVRVMDCGGSGTRQTLTAGLRWVLTDSASHAAPSVVLMPLAGGVDSADMHALMTALNDAGVVVVTAAGNDREAGCQPGSADRPGITVGPATGDGRASAWAATGECVDVYAPGEDVWSTWLSTSDAHEQPLSGASQAAALVAGATAAILGEHAGMTPDAVRAALTDGCETGIGDALSEGKLVCLPELTRK